MKTFEKYRLYLYQVNVEEVYKNCDKMEDLINYLSNFGFNLADARIYKQFVR